MIQFKDLLILKNSNFCLKYIEMLTEGEYFYKDEFQIQQ